MNQNYTLLQTIVTPHREGGEAKTTIYVYGVSDETYAFLSEVESFENDLMRYDEVYKKYDPRVYEFRTLHNAVLFDLEISEDDIVAPGAPFHRYEVSLIGGCVFLVETAECNI